MFVDDLTVCDVSQDDAHHLSRVLRLRPGETVVASDGRGSWRVCEHTAGGVIEPVSDVHYVEPPEVAVTIGFVPSKGDRPEWVVQKLTELGVDRIVVLRSERSVVRWDGERAKRAIGRLETVAAGAAAQSRRAWLPAVTGPVGVDEMARLGAALAEPGAPPLEPGPTGVPLCVGPEGGWSDAERASASSLVGLSRGVLRAETAAVAAAVLACALRDGYLPF